MLVRELIATHVGAQGAVHERGIRLDEEQTPPGLVVHHDGHDAVPPVAGDLLVVAAPVGTGLRARVPMDLPLGATVMLLFEVEVAELPVGRVLAALAVADLQVVEAVVVSGTSAPTVAVVATRTDDLVVPAPYLAHDLEPGEHEGPAALRRILGEYALEGLVQRARERALMEQVGQIEVRLGQVTAERDQLQRDRADHETMVKDLEFARTEAETEHKRMLSLALDLDTARDNADKARKEIEAVLKRMRELRASRSFKVASRLARASGVGRKIIRRTGR